MNKPKLHAVPEWFDGKRINEVLFSQDFLDRYPMKCINGQLFTEDGAVEDEEWVKQVIRDKLTAEQYAVTQESGTEYPYQNEFWNHFAKGIYVDIVTGEPLFSSTDKYESGCGWPAFTKPIEEPTIVEIEDNSHGMQRVEVRSRSGNSHLGHVFENDPESPNGVRYCINSASLRFIPYDEMEAEGYGYLMDLFE